MLMPNWKKSRRLVKRAAKPIWKRGAKPFAKRVAKPIWKNAAKPLVKEAAKQLIETAQTARQESKDREQLPQTQGETIEAQAKTCDFWDCDAPIRSAYVLCYKHYGELQGGLIDKCPGCGRSKHRQYERCLSCNDTPQRRPYAAPERQHPYRPEHSEAWEKRDAAADHFFVYILKLDEGKFYAGQTRELRERLSEHKDGRVESTKGRHPKLVWYGLLPTRKEAASTEVSLKKLIDSNPREVRRMVISFRDLVRELEYD